MDRPLNIGLVSAFDYAVHGGVNDHVRRLAAQFEEWGHRVRVMAPCSAPELVGDDNFIPMGRPVPIPSSGSIARISVSVWLKPRIGVILQEQAFDVIHVHNPFSGMVPANTLMVSNSLNVATFHNYGSRLYRIGGTRLAKPYFRKLHGLIAVSKPARDHVSRFFPGDYQIIPNGIDVKAFASGVNPLAELRDGMINLLFLGRLEKRKGLRYLLSAYSRLKWDWPNLRLIVVGAGRLDEESMRIMSERNLRDVIFVGEVSDEDKLRYFQTADIYCAPATGGESFGLVLLEAMAAGKPIVAAANEGYSTVLTHGSEGLLVPPKDDGALADAIELLLKDPARRAEMAANGRRKADEFRWERVAKRVMDYYETCLTRVAAPSR